MPRWTVQEMPDQTGRTIIVTGANSGLGFETTLAFAQKGAHIVMACRNLSKAEPAHEDVLRRVPDASVEVCLLYTSTSPRDGLLSRMPSSA